jgi:GcrA cell cycle regulator
MSWTETTIARLRALWSEGLPTAEIGRRLGLTKNAVVGKAHRLDLPARRSPIRPGEPSKRRAPRPPVPRLADLVPIASVPSPAPSSRSGTGATLPVTCTAPRIAPVLGDHPCRRPIGDPGTKSFRFCGERAVKGKPYCEAHRKLAYTQPRRPAQCVASEGRKAS